MSDSWESFLEMLAAECDLFKAVNERALALSLALVENSPAKIHAAQATLEEARKALVVTKSRRRAMQQRGFGTMPLTRVCAYAPRAVANQLARRTRELKYYTTALELVNSNNRALILGAMERLMAIVGVMRRFQAQPLTYKRRGIVPPLDNSMLMSEKA